MPVLCEATVALPHGSSHASPYLEHASIIAEAKSESDRNTCFCFLKPQMWYTSINSHGHWAEQVRGPPVPGDGEGCVSCAREGLADPLAGARQRHCPVLPPVCTGTHVPSFFFYCSHKSFG